MRKGQQWQAKLLLHSRTETEELACETWAPKYQTKYQIDGGVQRWGHPLAYIPRWLEGNGQEMLLEELRATLSEDVVSFSCIDELGEQNPALQVIPPIPFKIPNETDCVNSHCLGAP